MHKSQDVRKIYDSFWQSEYVDRFGNGSLYELEGKGEAILQSVYDNGTGVAKDIAAKFIDPSRYEMSSKQKWAISYAFMNLKPNQVGVNYDFKARTNRENIKTYNSYVNRELDKINKRIEKNRRDRRISAAERDRWESILQKEKERVADRYKYLLR